MISRDRVLFLHKRNYSVSQIAADLDCSVRQVERIRLQLGLSVPVIGRNYAPVSAERLQRAKTMLDEHASVKEVEKTLGTHERTIRKAFPGRAWTKSEAGQLGYAVGRAAQAGIRL